MLKVRLNCPICGLPIGAKSLEGHLDKVHELEGTVTLRLNPTSPYTLQVEVPAESTCEKGGAEKEPGQEETGPASTEVEPGPGPEKDEP